MTQAEGHKIGVQDDLREVAGKIRGALLVRLREWREDADLRSPSPADGRFSVSTGEVVTEFPLPGEDVITFRVADISEETISQELAQRIYWRERLTD